MWIDKCRTAKLQLRSMWNGPLFKATGHSTRPPRVIVKQPRSWITLSVTCLAWECTTKLHDDWSLWQARYCNLFIAWINVFNSLITALRDNLDRKAARVSSQKKKKKSYWKHQVGRSIDLSITNLFHLFHLFIGTQRKINKHVQTVVCVGNSWNEWTRGPPSDRLLTDIEVTRI